VQFPCLSGILTMLGAEAAQAGQPEASEKNFDMVSSRLRVEFPVDVDVFHLKSSPYRLIAVLSRDIKLDSLPGFKTLVSGQPRRTVALMIPIPWMLGRN
jgi:hypothetical protein